jgi:adrenodoxin-NADP+ reductase
MFRGLSVERSLARKGRSLFQRKTECSQRCQFSSGGDNDSTIRCAIVGSGPAGFYTAKYLLEKSSRITVDILESLPTPYGLVRQGVAPDHQEVKSVMSTFKDVAKSSRFRFFGNVAVGRIDDESIKNQISITELKKAYDVVVLAYGASSDKELDIPGERLNGVLSARSFVNWYNGHPNYKHIGESIDLKKIKRVVVIGQGNVAIDCAR